MKKTPDPLATAAFWTAFQIHSATSGGDGRNIRAVDIIHPA